MGLWNVGVVTDVREEINRNYAALSLRYEISCRIYVTPNWWNPRVAVIDSPYMMSCQLFKLTGDSQRLHWSQSRKGLVIVTQSLLGFDIPIETAEESHCCESLETWGKEIQAWILRLIIYNMHYCLSARPSISHDSGNVTGYTRFGMGK